MNKYNKISTALTLAALAIFLWLLIAITLGIKNVWNIGLALAILISFSIGFFLAKRGAKTSNVSHQEVHDHWVGLTDKQIAYINSWSWGAGLGYFYYLYFKKCLRPESLAYVRRSLRIGRGSFLSSRGGRKLIWEYGEFKNFEEFYNLERRINSIGFIVGILFICFLLVLFTSYVLMNP